MALDDKQSRLVLKPAGFVLAAAFALFAAGEAARAEYPPPLIFGRIISSSPEDMRVIREASAPLFDIAAAGASREWSNPQTGNSGTIKLRRIFVLTGMPCRTFDYTTWTAQHTNQTRVAIDWCKVAEDGWKLIDPRNPTPESPVK